MQQMRHLAYEFMCSVLENNDLTHEEKIHELEYLVKRLKDFDVRLNDSVEQWISTHAPIDELHILEK